MKSELVIYIINYNIFVNIIHVYYLWRYIGKGIGKTKNLLTLLY